MTETKKIKKLKKKKKHLKECVATCVEQMLLAADDLEAGANLIMYQQGQIAAYRDVLGLDKKD